MITIIIILKRFHPHYHHKKMTILWTGVKILIFWHIFQYYSMAIGHCMMFTSKINFCIHIKRECVLMHIYRWWCTSTSRAHKLAKTPKGLEDIRQLTPRRLYLFPPTKSPRDTSPLEEKLENCLNYRLANCQLQSFQLLWIRKYLAWGPW